MLKNVFSASKFIFSIPDSHLLPRKGSVPEMPEVYPGKIVLIPEFPESPTHIHPIIFAIDLELRVFIQDIFT